MWLDLKWLPPSPWDGRGHSSDGWEGLTVVANTRELLKENNGEDLEPTETG